MTSSHGIEGQRSGCQCRMRLLEPWSSIKDTSSCVEWDLNCDLVNQCKYNRVLYNMNLCESECHNCYHMPRVEKNLAVVTRTVYMLYNTNLVNLSCASCMINILCMNWKASLETFCCISLLWRLVCYMLVFNFDGMKWSAIVSLCSDYSQNLSEQKCTVEL